MLREHRIQVAVFSTTTLTGYMFEMILNREVRFQPKGNTLICKKKRLKIQKRHLMLMEHFMTSVLKWDEVEEKFKCVIWCLRFGEWTMRWVRKRTFRCVNEEKRINAVWGGKSRNARWGFVEDLKAWLFRIWHFFD